MGPLEIAHLISAILTPENLSPLGRMSTAAKAFLCPASASVQLSDGGDGQGGVPALNKEPQTTPKPTAEQAGLTHSTCWVWEPAPSSLCWHRSSTTAWKG